MLKSFILHYSAVLMLFYFQVLTTLRFLAKGEYLSETSDIHGISKSSASRIVGRVCEALTIRLEQIKMPTGSAVNETKRNFYDVSHFPNVIGCIDGTLIPIKGPNGPDEASYVCRKGYHAINVQAVCNAEMRFTNVVVRWPGSTHDAFILANSSIPATVGTSNDGWLLGDSGYPLKRWLMTPILHIQSEQEQRYNNAHASTRNCIERAFGLLKARFRCLHKTAGALPYSPEKSVKIIDSCFKLHNEAMKHNLPLPNARNILLDSNNTQALQELGGDAFEARRRLVLRF